MKFIKNMSELYSDHLNSGILNPDHLIKHKSLEKINKRTVAGYKLARERALNYYSLATGMFRYKTGKIDIRKTTYHNLYKGTDNYNDIMVGKIAIFKNMEDLNKFYPNWDKDTNAINRLVILKIELFGDIHSLVSERNGEECEMYAGTTILSIRKV